MEKQTEYYVRLATGKQWIFTTSTGGARARMLLRILLHYAGNAMSGHTQQGIMSLLMNFNTYIIIS